MGGVWWAETGRQSAQPERRVGTAGSERFSACGEFAGVKDVDGFGEVSGTVRAAA